MFDKAGKNLFIMDKHTKIEEVTDHEKILELEDIR